MKPRWLIFLFHWTLMGLASGLTFPPVNSEESDSISKVSVSVGLYLTSMAKNQLGVPQLKELFKDQDNDNTPKPDTSNDLALTLASGLRNKLDDIFGTLNRTASRIETSLNSTSKQADRHGLLSLPVTPVTPCCSSKRRSQSSICDLSIDPVGKTEHEKRTLITVRESFDENRRRSAFFVRQFLFGEKFHLESPSVDSCTSSISDAVTFRRRQIATATLHPEQKNVIIILERGVDQTATELNLGRSVALFFLKSLSSNDKIGIVTISNVAELVETDNDATDRSCRLDKLFPATRSTKMLIERHLNRIHHSNDVSRIDVMSGVVAARKMIENSDLHESVQLMFISPWKNVAKATWKRIEKVFSEIEEDNDIALSLNIYHLSDPSKEEVETTLFFDNSTKYVRIQSTSDLGDKMGDPFESLQFSPDNDSASKFKIFNVDRDPVGMQADAIVTIARTVGHRQIVVGTDVPYQNLFKDFILPSTREKSVRISIVDKSTRHLVYHPFLYDRVNGKVSPNLGRVAFGQIESGEIFTQIVDTLSGSAITARNISYAWHHVTESPYVVVIASLDDENTSEKDVVDMSDDQQVENLPAILPLIFFHRLDVLSPKMQSKFCRHFSSPATLESGSIFLSSDAVLDPWDPQTVIRSQTVESYMAYLTDKTSLISNPGIRPDVRDDVLKIAQITAAWKNMSYDSGLNNYIVRRYAATSRGVYYVYPGTPSSLDFEPARQGWFSKGEQFPQRVVATQPRLDPGGAGYIVSLSQAIVKRDDVTGIVGMDLTLGYIYKLLLRTSPLCLDVTVRCFLFDDDGYLIVHPDMFLVGEVVEQQHLTYKEPLVAGDILRHSKIARKGKCMRYTDVTVQRYYSFNVSFEQVLTNALKDGGVGSDGACSKYRVSGVHGTNLFLGIVESESNCSTSASAFCPCSVEDRWCILCDDKENELNDESTCECPCQCIQGQEQANLCPVRSKPENPIEPVCPPEVQRVDASNPLPRDVMMTSLPLPPCFERDCGRRLSKESCFGVIGCSWCEKEVTPGGGKPQQLSAPFCGEMSRCFYGIIGARSPYDISRREDGHSGGRSLLRGDTSQTSQDDFFFGNPTSSVGPIAGGIVGCFVFLAVSVCCLRSQQKCSIVNTLGGGTGNRNDSSLHVSNLEEDIEEDEQGEEMQELSAHVDILRICPASEITVSPYQMNPSYRRPPPGTDSDHGYSTMTPLGGDIDSEIVPYTDSASARDRLRKRPNVPPSSLHSVTSGVSSRTASPIHIGPVRPSLAESSALLSDSSEDTPTHQRPEVQPQQTQLAKHQFIVSATVHMEAH